MCEGRPVPGTEEYLPSEKYEFKVWDWDRPGHIKDDVAKLNRIRRDNRALHELTNLRFYPARDDHVLFYGKTTADRANMIFVAVNIAPAPPRVHVVEFPVAELPIE